MIKIFTFLFIFTVVLHSQNEKSPVIGMLDSLRVDGCGCYFQTDVNSEEYYLTTDLIGTAWVNIDGMDISLKFVKKDGTLKYKVGDKFSEFYSNSKYKIEIQYTVTDVCAPEEECEWTSMDVILIVEENNKKSIIKLKGGCGC